MIVRCSAELFEKFPEASIHGATFDFVGRFDEKSEEVWRLKATDAVRGSGIAPERLVEAPAIREWREAYQKFNVKPSKYRSSVEQLYRRALKGDIIGTRFPLVNLYCYASLIKMVPMGAYDLKKVAENIEIRLSQAGEEFLAIGEQKPFVTEAGTVVYADEAGVVCWAWNHRDSARTCLEASTSKAIFFADSAAESSRGRASESIEILCDALSMAGAIKLCSFVLDSQNREAYLTI
jgi:DNA/RNA-binding domain of Phe-tRNA-synthetase-like protein